MTSYIIYMMASCVPGTIHLEFIGLFRTYQFLHHLTAAIFGLVIKPTTEFVGSERHDTDRKVAYI